jgi:hypothetical protein
VGSQKNDVLTGDEKNNTIWANAGDDIVSTGAGNDWVEAQDGDDVVNLGSGNDQAVGGRGADTIDGGEGFDYARYDASAEGVNIDLAKGTATGGDATGDKLSNIEGLVGSQKNDVLTGDEKNNTIWANAGDDIVSTGAGNDWVEAQDGDDVVNLGSGDDQAVGGRGADTIDGGEGFDYARYDASAEGVNIDLAARVQPQAVMRPATSFRTSKDLWDHRRTTFSQVTKRTTPFGQTQVTTSSTPVQATTGLKLKMAMML